MTRATSRLRALTRLRGEGNRLLWLHLSTSGGKKRPLMVKTVTEVYSFYKYLVSIVIYSFYCKCNFTAVAIQQGNIKRFCQLIKTHLLIQKYEWHNDCSCFQYIKGSPEGCR